MIKYNTPVILIIALSFSLSPPVLSNDGDFAEATEGTNLQIVKNVYAGFAAGDMEAVLKDMGGGIVWTHPGDPDQIPFAGIFEGKAGVSRFFEIVFEQIDVLEQNIKSFIDGGDSVIVIGYEHMKVKNTGREYKSNWIHMYTLADGKIVAFEEFIDTAELVSAFNPPK